MWQSKRLRTKGEIHCTCLPLARSFLETSFDCQLCLSRPTSSHDSRATATGQSASNMAARRQSNRKHNYRSRKHQSKIKRYLLARRPNPPSSSRRLRKPKSSRTQSGVPITPHNTHQVGRVWELQRVDIRQKARRVQYFFANRVTGFRVIATGNSLRTGMRSLPEMLKLRDRFWQDVRRALPQGELAFRSRDRMDKLRWVLEQGDIH